MRRLLGAGLVLATLVLSALAGQSQPPSAGDPKSPRTPPGEPAKVGPPDNAAKRPALDKLKLPPGAILIFSDDLKDALKLSPRMFLLTPEQYQEMADRLSQAEQQPKAERPGECRLKATVEGDFVQVQAEFAGLTRKPRTNVWLGLRGARLTHAKIKSGEGESTLSWVDAGPTGCTASIEKAGPYRVTLNFRLPILFAAGAASRGAERSFEVGLPGSAVTTLTLELAQPVREIRWNKEFSQQAPSGTKQKRFEDVPLTHLSNLVLSWREPITQPDAAPLLTSKGQVIVKVEDQYVVTTAELTLTDLRGKARFWKLWLPWGAKVKVTPPEDVTATVSSQEGHQRTLTLSQPTVDPIKLTVTVQYPRSPVLRLPIGPFAVVDAFRQGGTIEVRATPTALRGHRLQYVLGSDTDPAPGSHGPDVLGVFRYSNMSVPLKLVNKLPVSGTAPLEIEIKPATGHVETSLEHRLHVGPQHGPPAMPAAGGVQVQVTTKIKIHARPPGDSADFLELQLPRSRPDLLALLARPHPLALPLARPYPLTFPDGVPWTTLAFAAAETEWQVDGAELYYPNEASQFNRRPRIKLSSPKEATITLTGSWILPAGTTSVRLDLPRPVNAKESRTKVVVEADDSLELLVQDLGLEIPVPKRHQYNYATDTAPTAADLAWRPYRPEVPVTIEADVTFHERDAQVEQRLTFQFPERKTTETPAGDVLRLSVPPAVRLHGVEKSSTWKLLSRDAAKGLALVRVPANPNREPLVLHYSFPLPAQGGADRKDGKGKKDADEDESRPFEVPLPWPEQATKARSKVRLWSDPGMLPRLAAVDVGDGAWRDRGTEVVRGKGLPTRVLLADGRKPTLLLRLDRSPSLLAAVVVDRALVQVKVEDDGLEVYVVRFRLSKVHTQGIDIRLPALAAVHSLKAKINGEESKPSIRDGKAHVPIPAKLVGQPVELELAYQLPRNQPEPEGLWQTILHPPEILGNVFLGRVRWQVTVPEGWVPVTAGADIHLEQSWGWHGWLPAPEPSQDIGQLEEWLTEQPNRSTVLPSLVCSRTTLEPLRLLRMPRQAWFLACSGVLLLVCLGLYFAPLSHYGFWMIAALLGLGVVAAGVLWPAVLPTVLYGCQPGALVLAVLLGFQWMLQQRYRRQVVFLPGFKRLKPGSSLVRSGRPREPSTVDAPAASSASAGQGSSQRKGT